MSTIAIDARIIESSTGIYMQRLLHFLHDLESDYHYQVLVPSSVVSKWQEKLPRFEVIASDFKPYSLGEQKDFNAQLQHLNADLVHFTMPQQPFLYTRPSVTTIHDTTLIRFDNIDMNPLAYKFRKLIFTQLVRTVIKRSVTIITPTYFVKDDLISFMKGKYAEKFTVTHEAGEVVDADAEPIAELNGKKYITFVGNAFPYKNVGNVIKAFALLKERHPELHLALSGKKDYFYTQLEKEVTDRNIPDVHFLGFISEGEKRWILQNAQCLVTASLSEGFCIPLLEAMSEGCPVACSDVSCLPEVAGEAALYFDPKSVDDIAAVTERYLTNPELRQQQIDLGYKQLKKFSWKRMAEQTLEVYKKALSN